MVRLPELLELTGATLVVVGLALWAVPVALVVAGLFLVAAANTTSPSSGKRPSADRETRAGR